jgi:outer membrane protein assembly factor BamB
MFLRVVRGALGASFVVAVAAGCGGSKHSTWPLPGGDLSGTRAATHSTITAANVHAMRPVWRFALTGPPGATGIFSAPPVADADTIYVEDLRSNVFALDRKTGKVRWAHHYDAPNEGPNGIAVEGGRVYGATDTDAFALAAVNGRELWRRHLTNRREQFVDVAPVPWEGFVFVGTVGYAPGGRGKIYGLDAATGVVRWRFDTIAGPWTHPELSGGGGIWYPVSVDSDGKLYAGTANPGPWGGTAQFPNGAAFPGPARYTDSLVVLDATTGALDWTDQVTPHDVRDYDFETTPILAGDLVFGAGKAGRVVAWNRTTHKRLWSTAVGKHLNDLGPLPAKPVTVCPNLLGGVETPMAYADNRLFVPVVDLCGIGGATTSHPVTDLDLSKGHGRLVALDASNGKLLWERRLPSPSFGCATVANDIVFTSTYDGVVYAFSTRTGKQLWRSKMPAGINACPTVVGNLLIVGAGVKRSQASTPEVVAFSTTAGGR